MKTLSAIVCLPFVLFACSGGSYMSPKETLTKFLTALQHGDFAEAKKYATANSQSFLDMAGKSDNGAADVYKNQDFTITDNVSINGDEAAVEVKDNSGGQGVNFRLQKQSGAWKVEFNLTTLFDMAKDALKKTGVDVKKEVQGAIDSLKTDLDSLP